MNVSDAVDLIRKEISLPEYFKKFLDIDELTSAKKTCCPLHMEKTPSFVYFDKSDTFYCYGCGAGYNVIDFHMKYNGFKDVHETIEDLAKKLELDIKLNVIGHHNINLKINTKAKDPVSFKLSNKQELIYLIAHGLPITDENIKIVAGIKDTNKLWK